MAEDGGRAPTSAATIRRGHVDDAEAIAVLYRRAGRECTPDAATRGHDGASVSWWVRTRLLREAEVWVAEAAGGVVGFMALTPPDALDQLYVLPEARRQGLASRFLSVARHRFPEGLQSRALRSSTELCRFFEHHGFAPVERIAGAGEEGVPDLRYAWRPGG